MRHSFLKKLAENISVNAKACVGFLFPNYCIDNLILKGKPDAWDYMPSVKHQKKAIDRMNAEDISARLWSDETLQYIFGKGIFWSSMTDKEFDNLIASKDIAIKALAAKDIYFTSYQMKSFICRYGLETLLKNSEISATKVTNFINQEICSTTNGNLSYLLPDVIKLMPEAYCFMLRNNFRPKFVTKEILFKMLDYYFSKPASEQYQNSPKGKLANAHYDWDEENKVDEFVWLSIAFHKLNTNEVTNCVMEKLNNIMSYISSNEQWQEDLLNKLLEKVSSFKQAVIIYDLYPANEKKHILSQMIDKVNNFTDAQQCYELVAGSEDLEKELFVSITDTLLDSIPKFHERFRATDFEASYLLALFPFDDWNNNQKDKAIRALAAGCHISDELYGKLSDKFKESVIEELEIFAQYDLISRNDQMQTVITDKINLFPEVEAFMIKNAKAIDILSAYISLHELSKVGYQTLVDSHFYSNDLLVQHAQQYPFTNWHYRVILNSCKKHLAPKLKAFLK